MQRRKLVISAMAYALLAATGHGQSASATEAKAPIKKTQKSSGFGATPKSLQFGLITPRSADQTLSRWNPFFERMSHSVGVPVTGRAYETQGALVADFLEGRLHLAWLGNAPALEIAESGKGQVYAAMVVQGKNAYRSLLITHRDGGLRSLAQVIQQAPQLNFGDGDLKSTSGHIVPEYFAFAKNGINDSQAIFKTVRRSSHEINLLAVANREVDLATNNTSELDNFRTANPAQADLIRVIWESPDIPESPMMWRDDLSSTLKDKVSAFTYRFGAGDSQEAEILWNINKLTAFRRSSNRQLVNIADLEMFNARQRVINDKELSADARAIQIGQITKRGSQLELMLKRSI